MIPKFETKEDVIKFVCEKLSELVDMLNIVNTKPELEAAEVEVKKYKWGQF